jgi:hypothetical protein
MQIRRLRDDNPTTELTPRWAGSLSGEYISLKGNPSRSTPPTFQEQELKIILSSS